jgi:hypothetical protein
MRGQSAADLTGVAIHARTDREVVVHILRKLERGAGGWAATPHLDHLRRVA